MTTETKAPEGMPVETLANPGEVFDKGREDRRALKQIVECPYHLANNRDRWREGWHFEDGIRISQEALASFERATAKENIISR